MRQPEAVVGDAGAKRVSWGAQMRPADAKTRDSTGACGCCVGDWESEDEARYLYILRENIYEF